MEDNSRGYNQRKYHQLRGAGELIEVHGGHIVRATGRKDRHSKVFTAKGPRDRRVRLSAHTAIQFYDVQDRLGYDRPSKAVDWLIQNAKAAIDQLAEPSPCNGPSNQHSAREPSSMLDVKADLPVSYGSTAAGFLLPLDGETSMKSFSVAAVTGSSYENCTPDLLPSASSRAQDLSLSLQSFQEPIFQQAHHQHSHPDSTLHTFFSGTTNLVHGATPVSWPSHNERMLAFNAADAICGGGGGGEFAYNVAFSQHNQGQLTQREPLQSSNLSPVRAWMDPAAIQQSSFSSAAAAAGMFLPGGYGGFPGFDIPVRVQGEAEQGGIARKPHSATHQ